MHRPAKAAYTRHCKLLVCGCKSNYDVPRESRKHRRLGIHLATQIFIIEAVREDTEHGMAVAA